MSIIPDARRIYVKPPHTFSSDFSFVPTNTGRGGDLDRTIYSTGRFNPDGNTSGAGTGVIGTRPTTMPTTRSGAGTGTQYPPSDMRVCDSTSSPLETNCLCQSIIVQNYGKHTMRIRQPFDFGGGRIGTISFEVDAVCVDQLATWIYVALTDKPVSCPTFHHTDNNETGPLCANSLCIEFRTSVSLGTNVGISAVTVINAFTQTVLTPTVQLSDSTAPTTVVGKRNYFEVRISATSLEIWGSDASPDNLTFPNFRVFYAAPVTMPFTQGYVHFGAGNHASTKEGLGGGGAVPAFHNYYWKNVIFDGPVLPNPRAYEVPDNTFAYAFGPDEAGQSYTNHSLGWQVSDGSGRTEGLWSVGGTSSSFVGAQTFTGSFDLTGMSSAILSLICFTGQSGTVSTSWGLKYKFNGGTWRTYNLSSAEAAVLNSDLGCSNYLCLVIPIMFADLQTGTNTIDFSSVNFPMSFPPQVSNIDLELS